MCAPQPRLLITGGSGYLGSVLAPRATADWDVVITYHSHPCSVAGCRALPLDVRNPADVQRLVEEIKPQAIVHAAADMSSPAAMAAVIAQGTRHVASAAAAAGVRLVHLSTDMVFDGERAPYAEDDRPEPITPYGAAKADAESAMLDIYPAAAIVRTSLIYGFAPPDPRTRWVLDSLRLRTAITLFTDEIRSPVWVPQLADALLELATARHPGAWHVAGPQPISRYAFGQELARAHGLDSAGLTPGLRQASGLIRPRDLTLDIRLAQSRLHSPLWGVDRVLASLIHAPLAAGR